MFSCQGVYPGFKKLPGVLGFDGAMLQWSCPGHDLDTANIAHMCHLFLAVNISQHLVTLACNAGYESARFREGKFLTFKQHTAAAALPVERSSRGAVLLLRVSVAPVRYGYRDQGWI